MVTLADVFQRFGSAYCTEFGHKLLYSHKQAMQAIMQCRTAALGGHVYSCAACDHTEYRYHSCRNRHCPQCQGDKAHQWLARQQEMLLPVPYFLLTFTLPAKLRPFARSHQKLVYNLLFRASAAATQQLAQNPRWLGGNIGMMGVLHTWGRNLSYHPHVHYLVPAGAWDGLVWRYGRSHRFFLPVHALSKLFRAKFRDALQQTDLFDALPASVWSQDWVVHSQPVGRGIKALRYLAPYIFRVAISNKRLLTVTDDAVTFRYRPSGSRQWRLCSVAPFEFIRRFLQHVLPKG
ncbi:MAG: transposase, partial [Aestuariibacter sp.]|nr:transposase [Aestuariibacter sp.]